MIYTCCDENRRAAVEAHATLNGIDWLEVLDADAPEAGLRRRVLKVRLLKPVPAGLGRDNLKISGGERVRGIKVQWAAAVDHVLTAHTDAEGDFSTYRLALVRGRNDDRPPDDFDSRLVEVPFSFKVECPSDFDCKPIRVCQEEPETPPDVDYLVKDYAGFRRLMLDRLSRLVPGWRERSAADLGVALTELLAYAGDHLSYWQDAVATEAYLDTARKRSSLRRHALLVDYAMHDGCNARAWVQVRVSADSMTLQRRNACFFTRVVGAPPRIAPDSQDEQKARRAAPRVFEPMHDVTLHRLHNQMPFYEWGDARCCLVGGAVRATLRGHFPHLAPGDVLIFREVKGPLTGEAEDADPSRRHAVRLTEVRATEGPNPLVDALPSVPVPITEIAWHADDALPFPICLSSETDEAHGSALVRDVSVALGNIVLADHGETIESEDLGSVPVPSLHYPPERDTSHCETPDRVPLPPRFRPVPSERPLARIGHVKKTQRQAGVSTTTTVPFDPDVSASAAMRWDIAHAVPAIRLGSDYKGTGEDWEPRRDLLDSDGTHPHFTVETEHDGTSYLRFGDDVHGKRPAAETTFAARYRVGNGIAGNVGAESIAHVVSDDGRIETVTNPMAARGGTEGETAEQVRRRAPQAFRTQERAVTPGDYADITERLGGVQRVAASLRWTGSWHTVFVAADREGGEPRDATFTNALLQHLDRYRMAGHDVRIDDPVYVSLEIDLLVCVLPDYFRSAVHQELLQVLGSGTTADGRRGLFHPDSFSFGETVYLSPIYAAARKVAGVETVEVIRFHRLGQDDPQPLTDRLMTLAPSEIARLDNDPNFPEHGVMRLELHGGK